MDIGAFVITAIVAAYFGGWLTLLAEAAWGLGADVKRITAQRDALQSQLAAAIKERDEWKRGWEAMERLNIRAIDNADNLAGELNRAEELITTITCAIEQYDAETGGEGEEQ